MDYIYRDNIVMNCPPYEYTNETVWKSIDYSRQYLGYTKKELAEEIGISPTFFSDCMRNKPDMRLSVAVAFTSAVGLSLDDAVRGDGENTYLRFLRNHGMDYYSLPKDSLLRSLSRKALIPTFYAAIDFCRDTRIKTIIYACLRMPSRSLYFYFRTVMGSDYYPGPNLDWMDGIPMDFDSLCKYVCQPKVSPLFWNGVRHEFEIQDIFPEQSFEAQIFADKLGLSVGQITKYLRNSRGETEKSNSEPRLKRATEICNNLGRDLDFLLEPVYSLQKWFFVDVDSRQGEFWTPFEKWYNQFYIGFRNAFRTFLILQVFVERFHCVSEIEKDRMTNQAKSISGI